MRDVDIFVHMIERVLTYRPKDRYTAWQVCAHPYYDILKTPMTKLPNGADLPPLFDFSRDEYESMPEDVLQYFPNFSGSREAFVT